MSLLRSGFAAAEALCKLLKDVEPKAFWVGGLDLDLGYLRAVLVACKPRSLGSLLKCVHHKNRVA